VVGLELPIEKNPKQRSDLISPCIHGHASPRSNTEGGFSEIDSGSKAEDRKKTSTIPNSGFPVNARTWKAPVAHAAGLAQNIGICEVIQSHRTRGLDTSHFMSSFSFSSSLDTPAGYHISFGNSPHQKQDLDLLVDC
jgi:hypothetical protein